MNSLAALSPGKGEILRGSRKHPRISEAPEEESPCPLGAKEACVLWPPQKSGQKKDTQQDRV